MSDRYKASRLADHVFAIWDSERDEFEHGPIDCKHEANRMAYVMNARESNNTKNSHEDAA